MLRRSPTAIAGLLCLAAGAAHADITSLSLQRDGAATPAPAAGWRVPLTSPSPNAGNRAAAWTQARQADRWPMQLDASVFGERGLSSANAGVLKYRWQLQSRWAAPVQLGLQGDGELAGWREWLPGNAQAQRLGPVLLSSWQRAQGQPVQIQAACLTTVANGRGGNLLSVRLRAGF